MSQIQFINAVKNGAISGWHKHKILPSISIAQAILESGWGGSDLSKAPNYNLFGIKASDDWAGEVVNMPTQEWSQSKGYYWIRANFRKYNSWDESIEDHGSFFTNTPWRKQNYARVIGEKDYKVAAKMLRECGYATDVEYPNKLIRIIDQYNLTQYDRIAFEGGITNTSTPLTNTMSPDYYLRKTVGDSLSSGSEATAKHIDVTFIGDSLLVGTEPKLKRFKWKKANYNAKGSRQWTHTDVELNAIEQLKTMLANGQVHNYVVFVLGTNRGVTQDEIKQAVDLCGAGRKILLVDTLSEVAHREAVAQAYKQASEQYSNVFYGDWSRYSKLRIDDNYYKDGPNGERIHMTPIGYERHANFIMHALYQMYNYGNTSGTPKNMRSVADIEYDDGIFTSPIGETVIYNKKLNDQFSFKSKNGNVLWIEKVLQTDKEDPQEAIAEGVAYMKEHAHPAVHYTVKLNELPDTVSIGDTGIFIDHEFNPPLAIEARILNITTSETNPNANTVTIGNVRELFPQSKEDILALQQQLQATREELLTQAYLDDIYEVKIESSNGLALAGGAEGFGKDLIEKVEGNTFYLRHPKSLSNGFKIKGKIDDKHLINRHDGLVADSLTNPIDFNPDYENPQGSDTAYPLKPFDSHELEVSEFTATFYDESGGLINSYKVPVYLDGNFNLPVKFERVPHTMKITSDADITFDYILVFEEYLSVEEDETTELTARVFKNGVEITDEIDHFSWTKVSSDGREDEGWKDLNKFNQTNKITIKASDLKEFESRFNVKAFDKRIEELIASNGVTIKNQISPAIAAAKAEAERMDAEIKKEIDTVLDRFDTERTETEQAINESLEEAKAEAERLDGERQTVIDGQIDAVISQADADRQTTSEAIDDALAEAERMVDEIYKYYDTTLLTTIWYRGESPDMQRISGQKNLVGLLVETAKISKEQANKAYLDAVAEAESKVQAKDDEYQTVFDDYDLLLNQATQDIQTSLSKADDALEKAGISTNLADTAKGLAEQAKQAADEATAEVLEIPTKISNYIDSKGLVDGTFVDEKVDEATGAWSLELARVESLVLPETFTVLTATWLRGENPQMNLSQIKNKTPQRGHVLYGAIWTKGHDPKMKRTTGEQALTESVSIFGAEYKRDVEGIYHELTRVESNIPSLDGYATQYWANEKFETAQSVSQKLSAYTNTESLNSLLADKADLSDIPSLSGYAKESWVTNQNYQTASDVTQTLTNYAKVSDLTGMVTETTLATKNYVTAGAMNTTLTSYLKQSDLNGKLTETVAFQDVKETTDVFTRVIGSTDAEAKTNIAQIAMTDKIFQTSVNDILDNKGYITDTTLTMSATWVKGANPVMQRTSKLEELIRLANSAQSGVEEINQNIKLESIMGMTWFKRPSPRMQPINKLDALNSAVSSAHSKITQLSDMIDLRVTADGLIGAINLQAGKTIFQQGTNKLMLTTDTFYMPDVTIESAKIKNINAGKIYGTSADFNNVRAGVLVADAVKSTHIEASTTLIDKLFATSALIGELTSKKAFIDSIKTVEIDAKKITSGTIDSARINVTDLRTKLLTAEVITASMLKADSALFDKLFAGTTMTDRLITKGAWITNANISSLDASKITSGTIDTARLNATDIVTKGLTANVIKSTHILADNALFEKLFTNDLATEKLATKQAWIKSSMIGDAQIGTAQIGQIDAGTGKIVNIDAQYITANHAKLVSAGFQGLNSNMHIDGGAIRIQNNDGDFATMNAIPEFRSQDSAGTSAILGKGRSQYYSNNQSRFYIGSSLNGDEYSGKVVHGVHISKNQTWGIYRQSDAFGGTPAQYYKTPAGWGAVQIIEELMRTGKIVNNFSQASALIRGLNGWGNSFPVLQPGDMVMYQAAVPGNSSGIERIWTMGTSSNGDTRTYSHVHHVFEGGTTGVSDKRLKHDIKPTDIKALDHIADLSFKQFKWNRNDELEPLGLIAQESGILRVPDEEMEGIDLQRAMMLALKGIQELSKKVQEMGA